MARSVKMTCTCSSWMYFEYLTMEKWLLPITRDSSIYRNFHLFKTIWLLAWDGALLMSAPGIEGMRLRECCVNCLSSFALLLPSIALDPDLEKACTQYKKPHWRFRLRFSPPSCIFHTIVYFQVQAFLIFLHTTNIIENALTTCK